MEDKALARIRCISQPVMVLVSLALGLLVVVKGLQILALLFLFHGDGGWRAATSASGSGIDLAVFASGDHTAGVALDTLTFAQRAALAGLAAMAALTGGMALYHLRQLFALYARGSVFDAANTRHMKRFGLWLAVAAMAANAAAHGFTQVTGQPAHDTANAVMGVIYGAMTYVVALVLDLGRQADVERKEFI